MPSSPKTLCPLCDKPWDVCTCQHPYTTANSNEANDLLNALSTDPNKEECTWCFDCSKKKGKPCIED